MVNHLTTLLDQAQSPEQFAERYFGYLSTLLQRLEPSAITAFIRVLETARQEQRTVLVAGNGGSASTASHLATDFGYGTQAACPSVPLRMIALTEHTATLTAAANDRGYAEIFVSQLQLLYRPGDVLIVISASGNSANLVCAASWVKAQGGTVLGLLGFDGGKLLKICDVAVHVSTPPGEYGPVEDTHLILNHVISAWLRHRAGVPEGAGKPTAL